MVGDKSPQGSFSASVAVSVRAAGLTVPASVLEARQMGIAVSGGRYRGDPAGVEDPFVGSGAGSRR
jgi:hypothetical protein